MHLRIGACFLLLFFLLPSTNIFSQKDIKVLQGNTTAPSVIPCGNQPPLEAVDFRIGATTTNPTSSALIANNFGSSTFIGKSFWVLGNFLVDRSITFIDCSFSIKNGAGISVGNGSPVFLESIGSAYVSCDILWDGFDVNKSAIVTMKDNLIQNANNGMEFYAGYDASKSSIVGNNFFDNDFGIVVRAGTLFNNKSCVGNFFQGSGGPLLDPESQHIARVGIHIQSSPSTVIGNSDASNDVQGSVANYFFRLLYGIVSRQSTCNITNCYMGDIKGNKDWAESGTGILATGSALAVHQGALGVSIEAELNGIKISEPISADIRGASINSGYGILVENSAPNGILVLEGNEIIIENEARNCGIKVDRASDASAGNYVRYLINNNSISINGTINGSAPEERDGIQITGFGASKGIAIINKNIVVLSGNAATAQAGIRVDAGFSSGYRITANNISFANTVNSPSKAGICFRNVGDGTRYFDLLANNTVGSTNLGPLDGILAIDAPNTRYCNNTTSGTQIGLHFRNNNDRSRLQNSQIGAHNIGMSIEGAGARIGNQVRRGNAWNAANYPINAARLVGNAAQSFFWTHSSDATFLPPNRFPTGNAFMAHDVNNQFSDNFCTALKRGGAHEESVFSSVEQAILEGNEESLAYNAATIWDAKRRLIYSLLADEALLEEHGLASWLEAAVLSTAGQYAFAQYQLDEASISSVALFERRLELESAMDLAFVALEAAIKAEEGVEAAAEEVSRLDEELRQLVAETQREIQAAVENVSGGFERLPNEANYMEYRKLVLQAQASWAIEHELDEALGEALKEVAFACRLTDGEAVTAALVYLSDKDRGLAAANQSEDCSNKERSASIEELNNVLTAYPNPAVDQLNIKVPVETTGIWKLVNAQGRIVLTGKKQENTEVISLDVKAFPSGVYTLSFTTNVLQYEPIQVVLQN